jgi:hypothetical protein
MKEYTEILQEFDAIDLNGISAVSLMDRIDTKFIFHAKQLGELLDALKPFYLVLEVKGKRISAYKSLYFDHENFQLYKDHHNSKDRRHKVRFRSYVDSNTHFLEVKLKRKGRTVKERISVNDPSKSLNENHLSFLDSLINQSKNLKPKLWNYYKRITLVSRNKKERLTLDLDLSFEWEDETHLYRDLVIAELKQSRLDRNSPFFDLMKTRGIRPFRVSKYCLGAIKVHGKKRVKYNRFKNKLLMLNKITNDF